MGVVYRGPCLSGGTRQARRRHVIMAMMMIRSPLPFVSLVVRHEHKNLVRSYSIRNIQHQPQKPMTTSSLQTVIDSWKDRDGSVCDSHVPDNRLTEIVRGTPRALHALSAETLQPAPAASTMIAANHRPRLRTMRSAIVEYDWIP